MSDYYDIYVVPANPRNDRFRGYPLIASVTAELLKRGVKVQYSPRTCNLKDRAESLIKQLAEVLKELEGE